MLRFIILILCTIISIGIIVKYDMMEDKNNEKNIKFNRSNNK